MAQSFKIGIIGSGIAGIASAIRMASRGHEVVVFEANSYAGGKLTQLEFEGYRFDAGPSLFTMPWLVQELFTLAGRDPNQYFSFRRKDVACRYFWDDGAELTAWANPDRFAIEAARTFSVPERLIADHLARSKRMYEATAGVFLEKSLHKWSTYLSKDILRPLASLGGLQMWSTLHESNRNRLQEPHLTQLFDRFATYNGSSPYLAPGTLHVIPHLEHHLGTYFPVGGMHAINTSLTRLAEELGVVFKMNHPVDRILHHDGRAFGLMSRETEFRFDRLICNMDVLPAYRKLLPDLKAPEKVLSQERSSSAVIFYWGINRRFDELDLHNIFFSSSYEEEFEALFNKGEIHDDPTVYVNISSKEQSEDAPPGAENWFVMINAPANKGQHWDEMIHSLRERVIRKLSKRLGVDLSKHIQAERTLDPRSIEQRTSSFAGSLYGTSSNSRLSAFFRHPNFSSRLEGLYFCGGSVHPGGGIPLCLLSARIVEEIMD